MRIAPAFGMRAGADGQTFSLSGELDLETGARLFDRLRPAMRQHREIWLELSRLAFIDSSGLLSLVRIGRALQPDGSLIVTGSSGEVADYLRLVRADLIPGLRIEDALDESPTHLRSYAS